MKAADDNPAQQYSFRLPDSLVEKLDRRVAVFHRQGLNLSRAMVVRMLLEDALALPAKKLK